ncbi:2-succinylbenzoate--CoA ligase [Pleurocapsales cyanobacterium LEGE 10410]|nr:2-succinylbenzoate--CoA ligase [Pleurocapsales cyanobacterium LEGE 10410]
MYSCSEILSQLKSLSREDWLWYYSEASDRHIINGSQELARLTEVRLQEISSKNKFFTGLKVLIAEANPIEFLATFLAGIIAEVDLFLCDHTWQQQEWQQVLSLVQPDLVYGNCPSDLVTHRQTQASIAKNPVDRDLAQQSLIMIPTGGTSGKIRFAMHSWATLTASVAGFKDYFGCQQINSCCTLPLYHVSGLMQFMRSFLTQGNIIFCSYKAIATKQNIFNRQDYFISLVPTQLQFLIESIPSQLVQFKTVLLGGALAAELLLNQARELAIPVAITYGMTETASGIVTLKPRDFWAGNHSSGQVLPHAKVQIESDNNVSFDRQIGLIKISCASLFFGYYPLFTQSQIFTTDDLGYFDERGYLHLVGRNSQKIITGGENVFPVEVEAAIIATKLVKDVCVIGISDRTWGQVVTAVYVPLESRLDLDLIKQQVQTQLAKYKQPKIWIEVDSLPRNNRGKINYQKLQAIAKEVISNK